MYHSYGENLSQYRSDLPVFVGFLDKSTADWEVRIFFDITPRGYDRPN